MTIVVKSAIITTNMMITIYSGNKTMTYVGETVSIDGDVIHVFFEDIDTAVDIGGAQILIEEEEENVD